MLAQLWEKITQTVAALLEKEMTENGVYYIGNQTVLPPPLAKEEEREFCMRLVENPSDEQAREQLIVRNLRLVVYIARKYESSGLWIDDLIQIGTVGLIKAVETFSPEKNIKLATYASRCIENEILMVLRKQSSRKGEISIEEPLNIDWDGNELLLSDILGSEPDAVANEVERLSEQKTLYDCVKRLPERDRTIIIARYGLYGQSERTQKEVADALGISQSYISRLEKRILKKLAQQIQV